MFSLFFGLNISWLTKNWVLSFFLGGKIFEGRSLLIQIVFLLLSSIPFSVIILLTIHCMVIVFPKQVNFIEHQWHRVSGDTLPKEKNLKPFSLSVFLNQLRYPNVIVLPRSFVFGVLASIFALAFIISNYWVIPDNPLVRSTILIFSICFGIVWCILASSSFKLEYSLKNLPYFALFLALVFILNYRALFSVLPWRGDEDFHIIITQRIVNNIPLFWVIAFLVFWVIILYLAWSKPGWGIIAGLSLILYLIPFLTNNHLAVLRYPFLNYWFFAIMPKLAMLFVNPFQEILYRIIPFLSAVVIAWLFQRNLTVKENPLNILWGFAVVSIPVVFYYSSILYLELPTVFLMLVVCFRAKVLFNKKFEELIKDPGWYALIIIGFIKETTVPFLFCFLLYRTVLQLWNRKNEIFPNWKFNHPGNSNKIKSIGNTIKNELIIYFVTLFPIIFYLVLRTVYSHVRSYTVNYSNLFEPTLYGVLARSFIEQFGVFLLFFLGGCVLLFKKRDRSTLGFYIFVIIGYSLFYMLDNKQYIGYSRFNLFFLPPILAGSIVFVRGIIDKDKKTGYILACLTILASLAISPVQMDGTKIPLWGNYLVDTSEHYYPYDEAIAWLHSNYPTEEILFAGANYPYKYDFYMHKMNWQYVHYKVINYDENSQNESENLNTTLTKAGKGGNNIVLYHVLGDQIPLTTNISFHIIKIIKNMAHILVIYEKTK